MPPTVPAAAAAPRRPDAGGYRLGQPSLSPWRARRPEPELARLPDRPLVTARQRSMASPVRVEAITGLRRSPAHRQTGEDVGETACRRLRVGGRRVAVDR